MRKLSTRDQIMDIAEDLLQELGFNAFSYKDISTEMGIKNAAIHYHFPAKADLGDALIQRFTDRFEEWRDMHIAKKTDPVSLINGYFAITANFVRNGGKVCPMGVLEAEFNAISDQMQASLKYFDKTIREFLTETLDKGRTEGMMHFDGKAEDKSLVISATLQGGLQIARVAGEKAFFATIHQLQKDLQI